MNKDELDAVRTRWSLLCGACDGGLPQSCTHPAEDPRGVILQLCDKLAEVTAERDEARTAAGVNWDASTHHHGKWVKAEARVKTLEERVTTWKTRLVEETAALREELAIARERAEQARNAVLELGDAIIRANGWNPNSGVTVELSSALERLVVERDLLRESRDGWEKRYAAMLSQRDNAIREYTAARSERDAAQAELARLCGVEAAEMQARQQAEQAQAERDAAYAALKAIDEHVTGMWTEIGDHQSHDYDVNDHDETLQAGHTAGRDAEHERITYDLRELLDNDAVRLATGVTCQPGQPWSCGDAHTAGHCVRPNASAAVPKADPISDDDTRCHLMDRENRNRDLVHSRKCWCQVAAPKADEHKANACICDTWREETPFGFSALIGADATCPVHGEEPLPAAAPDPAACIADDPDHAGMTCDHHGGRS